MRVRSSMPRSVQNRFKSVRGSFVGRWRRFFTRGSRSARDRFCHPESKSGNRSGWSRHPAREIPQNPFSAHSPQLIHFAPKARVPNIIRHHCERHPRVVRRLRHAVFTTRSSMDDTRSRRGRRHDRAVTTPEAQWDRCSPAQNRIRRRAIFWTIERRRGRKVGGTTTISSIDTCSQGYAEGSRGRPSRDPTARCPCTVSLKPLGFRRRMSGRRSFLSFRSRVEYFNSGRPGRIAPGRERRRVRREDSETGDAGRFR